MFLVLKVWDMLYFLPCKPICVYMLSKCTVQHSPLSPFNRPWRLQLPICKGKVYGGRWHSNKKWKALKCKRDWLKFETKRWTLEMDCWAAFCRTGCTVWWTCRNMTLWSHWGLLRHHCIFLLKTNTLFFQSCLKWPEEWPLPNILWDKNWALRCSQHLVCLPFLKMLRCIHCTSHIFARFLFLFSEMSCVIEMTTILSLGQHLLPWRN